jgi:hypothetical protein
MFVPTFRFRAFRGEKLKQHKCLIDKKGRLCVYDLIADQYTHLHDTSDVDVARVKDYAASIKKITA